MSIDLATKEEWDSILVNKPPHYNQGRHGGH